MTGGTFEHNQSCFFLEEGQVQSSYNTQPNSLNNSCAQKPTAKAIRIRCLRELMLSITSSASPDRLASLQDYSRITGTNCQKGCEMKQTLKLDVCQPQI